MNTIWRTLLGILVCWAAADAQPSPSRSVQTLFEEAQRYQLGTGRPVDVRKAYDLYREVLQQDPDFADAYYNLGGLCYEQKRYDLAEKYYVAYLKLRPKDGNAYNNLGTVYEKEGKTDRALLLYRKAVEVDSTVAAAHYNLSRLLLVDGKKSAAKSELNKALRLEPGNPAFVEQHSRLEADLGRISDTTIFLVLGGFVGVFIVYAVLTRTRK